MYERLITMGEGGEEKVKVEETHRTEKQIK